MGWLYTPQQQATIAASQAASAPPTSPAPPALITDQGTQQAMTAWAGKLPKACEDLTATPRITIPRQPGQTSAQIERRLAQSFPTDWLRFLQAQAPNAPWQTGWRQLVMQLRHSSVTLSLAQLHDTGAIFLCPDPHSNSGVKTVVWQNTATIAPQPEGPEVFGITLWSPDGRNQVSPGKLTVYQRPLVASEVTNSNPHLNEVLLAATSPSPAGPRLVVGFTPSGATAMPCVPYASAVPVTADVPTKYQCRIRQ
ncbi:MAG TPA: hypothetical protein VI322_03105 [Candidatus Saccharimonadia bacterium]